jgi:hypothetical protein
LHIVAKVEEPLLDFTLDEDFSELLVIPVDELIEAPEESVDSPPFGSLLDEDFAELLETLTDELIEALEESVDLPPFDFLLDEDFAELQEDSIDETIVSSGISIGSSPLSSLPHATKRTVRTNVNTNFFIVHRMMPFIKALHFPDISLEVI